MKKGFVVSILLLTCALGLAQAPMQQAKPTPADSARLAKLGKAYAAAKKALDKAPQSPRAKKDFVDIGVAYATESMFTPVLTRHVKYTQALRILRAVLKVDPKQPTAKSQYDLIISIYKQMGRPIPTG